MATCEKPLNQPRKNANTTFAVSSITDSSIIDSTIVEEKFLREGERDEDSDDGPVVFICGKCKLPIGDSTAWEGSEDGQNQIKLKRVTDNVVVGKDCHLYEISKRAVCVIVDLFCRGCNSVLGMVYTSTPKNMDHKRSMFWFRVADIDSYVLGSASQSLSAEGSEEQPVTLEYRGIVEEQITEMKMLVMTMVERLEVVEADLQAGCDKVCK
ncbi:protein Mis18-alpha [Mugil cephalus]|uniref:protein Mis18-alpha n=1 Tax=Mugil cephalus TaxID=48193 RepID=UPI001FB6450B|nr:protein Mis18-alpha [Mugil cephalus]